MKSIIEELYYGNIPSEIKPYTKSPRYAEAAEYRTINYNKLMATLNEEEQETFDKYCDMQGDIEGIAIYNTFAYALKFGILLMAEAFMGSEEITG